MGPFLDLTVHEGDQSTQPTPITATAEGGAGATGMGVGEHDMEYEDADMGASGTHVQPIRAIADREQHSALTGTVTGVTMGTAPWATDQGAIVTGTGLSTGSIDGSLREAGDGGEASVGSDTVMLDKYGVSAKGRALSERREELKKQVYRLISMREKWSYMIRIIIHLNILYK